jgi:hypothetical protein
MERTIDFVVRRIALLVGGIGIGIGVAFGGCGGERQGGNGQPGSGGGISDCGGSSGTANGGNASSAGSGGTGEAGSGGTGEAGSGGTGEAGSGGTGEAGSGGTGGDGGAPPSADCEPGTGFVGQLTGPGSAAPNGGIFTTDPESVAYGDANLDGVIAAYPDFDAVHAVDVDVQGAVVTATAGATLGPSVSASRTDFWIADENALLKVALDPELGPSCCPDFEVRTGMRISFKATEVSTFISLGQITAASNFVAGAQGNCVLVAEPDMITDVDFYQMVRVSAQLTGDPLGRGDFTSWQLGLSDAILYDFMSADPNLQTGQTVTFVGPVSPYVGYHMLVESNPDWVMVQN